MLRMLDRNLEQLSTFELVVLLAALARMHYTPSTEWLTHYFSTTLPRIPNCGPGHLTLMLRCEGCKFGQEHARGMPPG